ncbi:hypothetical protein TM1040_1637 [Ruegeria sp. TM1040]|nr:hypothetical protein TM1040_1637 [Ruegeria sp. TM1040]
MKIFNMPEKSHQRYVTWLERRVTEHCYTHQVSLNDASKRTGNSRSFLSSLFKRQSDIGIGRFFRICEALSIKPDAQLLDIAEGNAPSIDEVTDLVALRTNSPLPTTILDFIVIYAVPEPDDTTLSLLHLGEKSLAARVLPIQSNDMLQRAVDNFPAADRKKLVTSYQLAGKGTCLISIETLATHVHGQPEVNELMYKRLLFPVKDFNGKPAVGVYAIPASSRANSST